MAHSTYLFWTCHLSKAHKQLSTCKNLAQRCDVSVQNKNHFNLYVTKFSKNFLSKLCCKCYVVRTNVVNGLTQGLYGKWPMVRW